MGNYPHRFCICYAKNTENNTKDLRSEYEIVKKLSNQDLETVGTFKLFVNISGNKFVVDKVLFCMTYLFFIILNNLLP